MFQAAVICCIFLCAGYADASIAGGPVEQSIVQPNQNEYRAAIPNSDKHKFGYELGENKHFHHTTTEDDGVRLGCYGHVLEGKKYSTQYVADAKGYRPVYTNSLITVYPKSGGERKASFIRDFSEDIIMSQNIRFFFPDGCIKKAEELAQESRRVVVTVRPSPTTTTTTKRPVCSCACDDGRTYVDESNGFRFDVRGN